MSQDSFYRFDIFSLTVLLCSEIHCEDENHVQVTTWKSHLGAPQNNQGQQTMKQQRMSSFTLLEHEPSENRTEEEIDVF